MMHVDERKSGIGMVSIHHLLRKYYTKTGKDIKVFGKS